MIRDVYSNDEGGAQVFEREQMVGYDEGYPVDEDEQEVVCNCGLNPNCPH